ncbi:D-alanyl-D-alanine carboxypeptidase/D-alanyl-D-alanine-endopeptidase [Pseudanabaena biceps PCC 7429]|uniref:D-alanyl-D-alanine carboxypeptidase/D-alanyl-D-alanine-endopeptidase n=2 Tax=Pseudanabaena TaxID=1152 RepID=L8MWT2_9CYAN|nr:D-alanyl-D-alanine carboxypeptidase/D-alanyl-D-alanine-endopeptidase [Pseudanabaena biceps PCC 7429]
MATPFLNLVSNITIEVLFIFCASLLALSISFYFLMKNSLFAEIALILSSLIVVIPAQAQSDRLCPAQMQKEVEKIAQSPKLNHSRIGVFIQTNETKSQILASLDSDRYFIPASNTKLFVTATALKTLGADYRFATRLMSHNLPNDRGEIDNGLWLVASGDPSLQSATGLKSLVTQLKNKGVKQINGGIWTLTARKGAEIGDNWEWGDLQEYYGAKASPFTINENALDWVVSPSAIGKPAIFAWEEPNFANDWRVDNQSITVGADEVSTLQVIRPYGQKVAIITGQVPEKSEPELGGVAIPDPEANLLALLHQELIAQGITISLDSNSNHNSNQAQKLPPIQDLAIALSPPLSELISITNKNSNNLYAELLLRALGDRFHEVLPDDSVSGGLLAVNKYLQSINIPPDNALLVDGSGLSRRNLTTPKTIVQLLQSMASDRHFRRSLAIAGVDGSLTNRFKNTDAQGLIQAKTGGLTGAVALSGYASPPHYREVIFSIIINNSNLPSKELKQYIDAIALLLTRLETCE